MQIADAQSEMRAVYLNGASGQAVSAVLWAVSAACATWISTRAGVLSLVVGGMFIFPVTQAMLALMRRPVSVSRGNPLRELAPQVAFIVPLAMPLVGAAALYKVTWFYPGFMILVGVHYLPFAFLYGRPAFLALAGVLLAAGLALALLAAPFAAGGWLTAAILAAFAVQSAPGARRA
jgi:hypothetical protein